MKRAQQGKYVNTTTCGETVKAFIPSPLPPKPEIDWTPALRQQFEQAYLALGRLDSVASLLPDANLFLYMYIRKEAVLSSMIEGTQSSLSDLLMYELEQQPGVPIDDAQEVSNYAAALTHGIQRLKEGFPLSLRLLKEIHAILLSGARGNNKQPGELRRSQNWIGGTRPGNAVFVPPPAEYLAESLSALEKFIHNEPTHSPSVLKAAMTHVQFETLHPFLDGDWESWLEFFANAIEFTANAAVDTAKQLMNQAEKDTALLLQQGRFTNTLSKLHQALLQRPITTAAGLEKQTGLAKATIQTGLHKLEELKLLEELTGKRRDRIYAYKAYIAILNQGNDLP